MKKIILSATVLLLFATAVCPATAQSAGRTDLVRSALTKVMDSKRAQSLKAVRKIGSFTLMSDSGSGYAIVVEHADGASVLAYGQACLEDGQIPSELEGLFEDFASAALANQTESRSASSRRKAAAHRSVAPLIQTHWAQSDANNLYNAYCPTLNGKRSVVGCLPIALAQVLKYHAPSGGRGKKAYYVYNFNGSNKRAESFDFTNNPFKWSQMPARLTKSSSTAEKEAVGKLLHACGVATNAMYHPGRDTNAFTVAVNPSVSQIFEGLGADTYWYNAGIVYEELAAGRPVLYIGNRNYNGQTEGHCFIIDGCDTNGYLHCNMGWDRYDGYFDPTVMYGYNIDPFIITIRKRDNSRFDTPITELQAKIATTWDSSPGAVEANKWYVLWNADSGTGVKAEDGDKGVVSFATYPAGESTSRCAGQLVRLVVANNGRYYIQTGNGKYLLLRSDGTLSTTDAAGNGKTSFAFSLQGDGSFSIEGNGLYLNTSVGADGIWSNKTIDNGSKSWKVFPVQVSDDPQAKPYKGSHVLLQTMVAGLLNKVSNKAVGFPTQESAKQAFGWSVLNKANQYGITASNYPIVEDAYNRVAAVTAVNLPEKDKSYYVRAVFQDGTLGYLAHDAAGRLTLSSTPDYAFKVENSNGKVKTFLGENGYYLSIETTDKPSIQPSYVSSYCDLSVAKQFPNVGNGYGNVANSLMLGCLTLQGVCATGNTVFYLTANSQGGFDNGTSDQLFFDCTAQNGKYRSCQFRFEEVSAGRLKLEQTGIADELELNSGTVTEQVARDLQGRIVSPANTRGIILQNGKKILR